MTYRLLTNEEISLLLSHGCFAHNWSDISVKQEFSADNIRNTCFEGKIILGILTGTIDTENGISKKCGIYNSYISNFTISDITVINTAGFSIFSINYTGKTTKCYFAFKSGISDITGRKLIFDRYVRPIPSIATLGE